MAKKTILEIMKSQTIKNLEGAALDLLDISQGEAENPQTKEKARFVRLEVEVPRSSGAFSRCRFSVKIPDGVMKLDPEDLEEADFQVTLHDLEISYIDQSGNVYFRAETYNIVKEGE